MSNFADFDLATNSRFTHLEFVIGNWGFAAKRRPPLRGATMGFVHGFPQAGSATTVTARLE